MHMNTCSSSQMLQAGAPLLWAQAERGGAAQLEKRGHQGHLRAPSSASMGSKRDGEEFFYKGLEGQDKEGMALN